MWDSLAENKIFQVLMVPNERFKEAVDFDEEDADERMVEYLEDLLREEGYKVYHRSLHINPCINYDFLNDVGVLEFYVIDIDDELDKDTVLRIYEDCSDESMEVNESPKEESPNFPSLDEMVEDAKIWKHIKEDEDSF